MNTDLFDLKQVLKQNYIKVESELSVARQFNSKLKDHKVSLERQCWSNYQYSRREYVEISDIPDKNEIKMEYTAQKMKFSIKDFFSK